MLCSRLFLSATMSQAVVLSKSGELLQAPLPSIAATSF